MYKKQLAVFEGKASSEMLLSLKVIVVRHRVAAGKQPGSYLFAIKAEYMPELA
jgi:hypothetical protein